MHGTTRPNVPLNQRLVRERSPIRESNSQQEARKALLVQLSQSREVSDATREWARQVLEILS
jgi:hypothetical protein